jgi:hypothetical protein
MDNPVLWMVAEAIRNHAGLAQHVDCATCQPLPSCREVLGNVVRPKVRGADVQTPQAGLDQFA